MRPREPIVRKGGKKTTKKDRPLTEKVEIQRNKDGLFACDKCPFANRSRLRLQQHAYGHERKDGEAFRILSKLFISILGGVQCPHCSFKQPSVGFMQMHIRLHEKEQKDKQLLFKRRRQAVAKCLTLYSERVHKRRMQREVKAEIKQEEVSVSYSYEMNSPYFTPSAHGAGNFRTPFYVKTVFMHFFYGERVSLAFLVLFKVKSFKTILSNKVRIKSLFMEFEGK